MDPNPPKEGYVTTRKAAQLYGKSESAVLNALKAEGVTPLITEGDPRTGGRRYWWNPLEVLKARAVRAERMATAQRLFGGRARAGTLVRDRKAATLKGRHTRLEHERRKILARLAERTQ